VLVRKYEKGKQQLSKSFQQTRRREAQIGKIQDCALSTQESKVGQVNNFSNCMEKKEILLLNSNPARQEIVLISRKVKACSSVESRSLVMHEENAFRVNNFLQNKKKIWSMRY